MFSEQLDLVCNRVTYFVDLYLTTKFGDLSML
jgi:hypothetical protein